MKYNEDEFYTHENRRFYFHSTAAQADWESQVTLHMAQNVRGTRCLASNKIVTNCARVCDFEAIYIIFF